MALYADFDDMMYNVYFLLRPDEESFIKMVNFFFMNDYFN